MKTRLSLLLAAAIGVLHSSHGVAQVTAENKTILTTLTNLPTLVAGGAQVDITSYTAQKVDLSPGKGLGLTVYFAGTNAATVETQTISVAPSYDGTNYATTNFWILSGPVNGTTGQRLSTNFPASMVGSFRKARVAYWKSAADPTNRVFITNIVFHVDN